MSPTQKGRTPTATPPVTRRSARQERIDRRRPGRDLQRASTKGKMARPSPMLIGTAIAIVAGIALIGFAILSQPSKPSLSSIHAPAWTAPATIPTSGARGTTLGNTDAKVSFDEYGDYQCPTCGSVAREWEQQLVTDFVQPGKVKYTFHDWNVNDAKLAGSTESRDAANAAACAGDQGKFWPYHEWLFANQVGEFVGSFSQDRLFEIGRQLNLDTTKFETCVKNGDHFADINASSKAALALGTQGTPTFTLNGSVINPGNYDDLKRMLTDAVNATPAPSGSQTPAPSPSASASASVAPTSSALIFGLPLAWRLRRRTA